MKEKTRVVAQFFSQGITFLLSLIFIFVIGTLYAFIRPEDLLINIIFFTVAAGWMVFVVKLIWDAMDKSKNKRTEIPNS